MSSGFPNTPYFVNQFLPVRTEADVQDLTVEGEIPSALQGDFVRIQPDPLYPPRLGDDLFFHGEGAVTRFRFRDGNVDLKQRYVKTERYKLATEARRSLFGKFRNGYTNDPSVEQRNYTRANTNIIPFNGKLLAMEEDSRPYAMDPDTLDTLGLYDFEGQCLTHTFTSHSKFDPVTGNLIGHSYEAKGDGSDDICYLEFDTQSGEKVREIWVKSPYVGAMHDFTFTNNYVIFPLQPLKVDLKGIKEGGNYNVWDPDQELLIGIMRRDGDGTDLQWVSTEPAMPGHCVNAYEEGDLIHLDMGIAYGNPFSFMPDKNGYATPLPELRSPMTRTTFDMAASPATASKQTILEVPIEFGRIDERYIAQPYTYGFFAHVDFSQGYDFESYGPPPMFIFNALAKVNMQTGEMETWGTSPHVRFQEAIFVPRSENAPEGDGFVLSVMTDLQSNQSELVILDATKFTEGPVARIKSPLRMRFGLHGNWVPAD